ncbi:DUF2334 domain-containing protein [Clostridium sp. SHJSY1]|uniref:DUF2334 domain-containing protein n=1 Tax=Clostridium sp. SHJSY1 TaxID=2942483 RepID=UPI002874C635|nr:DUF2334 domain-containing protein [Clostridium sp. SHJSY1]MDS0524035.1 DUF2334 domain-containing protein [Clostridium sp. SHJSY1]
MKITNKLIIMALTFLLIGCSPSNSDSKSDNTLITEKPSLDYNELKDLNIPKDDIKLKINGKILELSTPIYLEKNRYYFCLNDIVDKLNGSFDKDSDSLHISLLNKSFDIDTSKNIINSNNKEVKLKKSLISQDDFYFIGLSDLSDILEMYTRWDVATKTISCKTEGYNNENITPYISKIDQVGYLRLEDIDLTTLSYDKEFLEKLRIIGNYLYKKNIPYHIAWIPRFVSPQNNIDIDPMTQNDFRNAEMIFTLDFFTKHNGSIGLHGYTHQSDNEESAIGTEFGHKHPSTERFKERIEKALATAKYLDIPIDFFETPHYQITAEQNKIAEQYFKILYHPFQDAGRNGIDLTKPQLSPYNKSSYYISTPLDYIPENKIDSAINFIKNADINKMGSVFFHPRLDFSYITLSDENGTPSYNYTDNSVLKRVISALEEKGFKMSKVTDIK